MVFEWFLDLPSLVIIVFVSLLISVITTLVYKFVTDQDKLKSIHAEQKEIREEMKLNKDKPDKVMKLQKRAMEINMQVMPQTFKSMIVTFIPIILIFTWLSGHIAFAPLQPGEIFTSTMLFETSVPGSVELTATQGVELISLGIMEIEERQVQWELRANEGTHSLTYEYGQEVYNLEIMVTDSRKYSPPKLEKQKKLLFIIPVGDGIPKDSNIQMISVDLQKTRPFGSFSIFGYFPGWLATYLISSIIFSTILRKWLKVF